MRILICGLVIVFLLNMVVFGQAAARSSASEDVRALRLKNVNLRAQTIGGLLSELSLSYDIPIGLEIARSDNSIGDFELNFKNGTLSELLTELVTKHESSTWSINEGVINILPKQNQRDGLLPVLLAGHIKEFSVEENTSCLEFAESVLATTELKNLLEQNSTVYRGSDPTGFYIPQLGRHFTLKVSESTLQSTLNTVIRKSPTAKFWVLTRNPDGTVLLALSARHEDMPAGTRFSSSELRP